MEVVTELSLWKERERQDAAKRCVSGLSSDWTSRTQQTQISRWFQVLRRRGRPHRRDQRKAQTSRAQAESDVWSVDTKSTLLYDTSVHMTSDLRGSGGKLNCDCVVMRYSGFGYRRGSTVTENNNTTLKLNVFGFLDFW